MTEMPTLVYDSEFDIISLRENKPYRNIGQLLMSEKSVRNALRLCGCEERVLNGEASDYECFCAICVSMEYLIGHRVCDGVKRLLSDVFGVYEQLSPYNCEELWGVLNDYIDDNAVTPISLLSALNVESLSIRVSPFENFDVKSSEIDLYSITDLGNIVSLVVSDLNHENELEGFISKIASVITERDSGGSPSVALSLGRDYEFERMSRKHEVYEIYTALKCRKNVSISEQNGLITYVLTSLFGTFCTLNCNILTDIYCPTAELRRLLDYQKLNKHLPTSMLIKAKEPEDVLPLALEFSRRNEYGLPSIVPLCGDAVRAARIFPIGFALEYQDCITDTVSVAALISSRERLYNELSSITDLDPDSAVIDLTYANIKNRIRI